MGIKSRRDVVCGSLFPVCSQRSGREQLQPPVANQRIERRFVSRSSCLLVDPAVRGSMVDEDADDVYVSPPGGEVQWEAPLVVLHICGRLVLQQLQHHIPTTDTYRNVPLFSRSNM